MGSLIRVVVDFVRELRRRRVFRVAIVYAAVGWILMQVSATAFPALDIPPWGVSLVVGLVILGFPIAIVLAWSFDVTPEGFRRTGPVPAAAAPGAGVAAAASAPAAGAPAATPAPAAGGTRPAGRDRGGAAASLRSIAALPLVDRSPGGAHQFLGDGITEELISALARVEGLRVVSRTSAFTFRGEDVDVFEIGERLGVGSVLEGSVRVAGDRLRLTVQLIAVADGYAIWSEVYDRRVEDLLAVQEEIARAIVAALSARLAPEAGPAPAPASLPSAAEAAPLLSSSTQDIEAYTLYLRGRQHWNERTPAALRRAIASFEQAIARDGRYAHAHAGLADCYAILLDYGVVSPEAGLEPARRAAGEALALGPHLAEAHTSAALVRQMEWRWADAEQAFRRAIELDPAYVIARQRYALLLAWLARFEESRLELERARRLDPLSPVIAACGCWLAYYEGRHEDAVRAGRAAVAEHPRFGPARIPLGLALLAAGHDAEAVAELEQAAALAGETSSTLSLLVHALARAGRAREAKRLDGRLRERARREYVSPYYLALPLLGLGDPDGALAALSRAADERSPQLVYLAVEPLLAPLRERPAFRAILERVGLPA